MAFALPVLPTHQTNHNLLGPAAPQEGYVQRQPPGRTTLPEVRQHFLSYAAAEGECGSADADAYCPPRPVVIARLADGLPKLLSRQDFVALCDRLESGQAAKAEDAPALLQVGSHAHGRQWPFTWC